MKKYSDLKREYERNKLLKEKRIIQSIKSVDYLIRLSTKISKLVILFQISAFSKLGSLYNNLFELTLNPAHRGRVDGCAFMVNELEKTIQKETK